VLDLLERLPSQGEWDDVPYKPSVFSTDSRLDATAAFFGKVRGDRETMASEGMEFVREIRTEIASEIASTAFNEASFLEVMRRGMCALTDLPPTNPFHLPPVLVYNGPTSPNYTFIQKCLGRMCWTAHAAHHGQARENFSGFAVSRFGVGKSTFIKTAAVLGGVFLPNMQTIYMAAAKADHDVLAWVRSALSEVDILGNAVRTMDGAVQAAKRNNCAIGLFVDELPELYHVGGRKAWDDLDSFVTTTVPTFAVVTGPSSILPALVKKDRLDVIIARTGVNPPFAMLNKDKLKLATFEALRTKDQYRTYLRSHPLFVDSGSGAISDDFLWRLHIATGGRLREIRAYDPSRPFHQLDMSHYPSPTTVQGAVYADLARRAATSASPADLDPFKMPALTLEQFRHVISAFFKNASESSASTNPPSAEVVLSRMMDEDQLCATPDGTFTFSVPLHFLLARSTPTVFISHRLTDGHVLRDFIGELNRRVSREVCVVTCEGVLEQDAMAGDQLQWMKAQSCTAEHRDILKRSAVVLVTEEYAKQVERMHTSGKPNGCGFEFETIAADNLASPHVILAYDGKASIDMLSKTLAHGDDRLLERLRNKTWYNVYDRPQMQTVADRVVWASPNITDFATAGSTTRS
jgi:hypothetical protein